MNTTMLIIIAILTGIGMLAVDSYFEKKEQTLFNSFLRLLSWFYGCFIFLIICQ